MAGELSLKTPLTGLVTLVPTNTATDKTITLPATTGTMVVQDGTNTTTVTNLAYTGTLTGGTGVVNLGSGQVYKDASGNVGIGVTPSFALDVLRSANTVARVTTTATGSYGALRIENTNTNSEASIGFRDSSDSDATSWVIGKSVNATDVFGWYYGGAKMTLDTSGNLGIGTTSPAQKLHVVGTSRFDGDALVTTGYSLRLIESTNNNTYLLTNSSNDLTFVYNASERMRIDSSGNLLVGTQSWSFSNNGTQIAANGRIYNTSNTDYNLELAGSTSARIRFYTSAGGSGTTVGTITVSGSATTYATSSDYRLKENVVPMTGALATVAALKPVTYKWKADGSAGQGFIAHELQAVVPDCVTGTKDAIDAEGKPQYQGVDTSFLVATLTAAIQELTARLEVLENK